MKKALALIILITLAQFSFSQTQLITVSGNVSDTTGNGIPNYPVTIYTGNVTLAVLTDVSGNYFDSLAALPNDSLIIAVQDCNGQMLVQDFVIGQGTNNYTANFVICGNSSNPCSGTIIQNVNGSTGTFSLNTQATGGNIQWLIDGITFNAGAVTYTFPSSGWYSICATYSSVFCAFTVCDSVFITVNPPSTLSLAGNVFKSNVWAQSGLAFLYSVDSTPAGGSTMIAVDTTTLDSGMYYFSGLNAGVYRVQAMLDPNDPDFLNYFPTYYGDVVNWSNASDIVLNSNSYQNDINLVAVSLASPGPGGITGSVIEGPNKAFGPGDPLKDVIVLLRDASGTELEYDLTNANGEFSFSNIALGDYQILLEIANESMNPHLISLTANQSTANATFQYDTLGVQLVLGFEEEFEANTSVFPNPAVNTLNISISESDFDELILVITDIQGKEKSRSVIENKNAQVEIGELPSGVYFLNLLSDKGQITKRFVKQ